MGDNVKDQYVIDGNLLILPNGQSWIILKVIYDYGTLDRLVYSISRHGEGSVDGVSAFCATDT